MTAGLQIDAGPALSARKNLAAETYTGNLYEAIPRLRECCRQVEAEDVSNSRNKFIKPGTGLIEIFCIGLPKVTWKVLNETIEKIASR